jgi:hypothetical protein
MGKMKISFHEMSTSPTLRLRKYFCLQSALLLWERLFRWTPEWFSLSATNQVGYYAGCSDVIASNYAQITRAVSLEILSSALDNVSGFSKALDFATHHGQPCLDIRIRFTLRDTVSDYHLLAIPLHL